MKMTTCYYMKIEFGNIPVDILPLGFFKHNL